MTDEYPLSRLRVVELSPGIAGSYAGRMLSDGGADVLRLEPPGGDALRRWKASAAMGQTAPLGDDETGVLFHYLCGGKGSAVVDPSSRGGRDELLGHCRDADVLIEDGPLAEAGLTPEDLHKALPGLTVVSITPWGRDGPYAGRAASEFTLQAEVGATAYRGYSDRLPVAAGGEIGDYVCGTYTAVAALSAWRAARAGGRGRIVEVSQLETMLLSFQPYQYIHSQLDPGNLVPRSVEVPSIEPARDGWVGFCTITGQQWRAFAEMIGHPGLGEEAELTSGYGRFEHIDRVLPLIHEWTRARSVEDIVHQAVERRIPVAPVGNGRAVLDMEQFVARDVFRDNPAGFRQPRPPYRPGRSRLREPAAAPEPGSGARHARRRPSASAPRTGQAGLPLAGIRVADFSAFWAGPIATACMAALGADVIKVESVQRPDGMRFAAGFYPEDKPIWECSPISHGVNTNKRDITLDLSRQEGLDLAKRLVAESDVVLENFSPRVMEKFGLGWETVREVNPEAIMVRMPAFGLEGPWRDRTGFAMTIEQVSGLAWRTGYPDRAPLVPRGCVDPLGGMDAVFATLCALEDRDRGAGGQLIEVVLAEAGLAVAAEQMAEYTGYGALLERAANRGPAAVPQGVFACADEAMVAISVGDDAQWQALKRATEIGAQLETPLETAAERRTRETELEELLARYCAGRAADEVIDTLVAAGVPVAPLSNIRELDRHPHLRERGFFRRLHHPVTGELDYPAFPFRFDGEYPPVSRPAPLLGEHNEEVLTGLLGVDPAELERLERDDVIGTTPTFMRERTED